MHVRHWPGRRWAAAVLGAATAFVIGFPAAIIRTSFYHHRMTPVLWWNYPVWAVIALLSGLILATYVRTSAAPDRRQSAASVGSGTLTLFAVGCPLCNKIVVALVGVSGR